MRPAVEDQSCELVEVDRGVELGGALPADVRVALADLGDGPFNPVPAHPAHVDTPTAGATVLGNCPDWSGVSLAGNGVLIYGSLSHKAVR